MFLLMLALVVLYVLRSECDPKSNSSREVRHSARYTDDSKDFYTHTHILRHLKKQRFFLNASGPVNRDHFYTG